MYILRQYIYLDNIININIIKYTLYHNCFILYIYYTINIYIYIYINYIIFIIIIIILFVFYIILNLMRIYIRDMTYLCLNNKLYKLNKHVTIL